jgi:hypothetical protein
MGGRRSADIGKPHAELDYLHELFTPRHGPYVALQSVDTEALALYELLHQLNQRQAVTLEYQHIPFTPFAPKPEPSLSDVYKWQVWTFAMKRRSEELRDWAWSGYRYLQSLHPKHRLETSKGGAPFMYLHRKSGTAITTGNCDVSAVLQEVVHDDITQLLLVGDAGTWRADESEASRRRLLDIAVLTFDEIARAAFGQFFAKQNQALLAAVPG